MRTAKHAFDIVKEMVPMWKMEHEVKDRMVNKSSLGPRSEGKGAGQAGRGKDGMGWDRIAQAHI